MSNRYDLKGKIAMITGAGSGIGREVSRVLAEEGAVLALVDTSEADLKDTARLIQETASDFELFNADVSDRLSMDEAFEKIESKWSRLDILVTCARIMHDSEGMALMAFKAEGEKAKFEWLENSCPDWPHLLVRIDADPQDVLEKLHSNHVHATGGDWMAELELFVQLAGIRFVTV